MKSKIKFRRAGLSHDFTVKTRLKNAAKSDEEHKEKKNGKVRKAEREW